MGAREGVGLVARSGLQLNCGVPFHQSATQRWCSVGWTKKLYDSGCYVDLMCGVCTGSVCTASLLIQAVYVRAVYLQAAYCTGSVCTSMCVYRRLKLL